jgi:hypothetical protein
MLPYSSDVAITFLPPQGTHFFQDSIHRLGPNVMVEWLTSLLPIRDVPGSYLGSETGYPEFYGFPQSLRGMPE